MALASDSLDLATLLGLGRGLDVRSDCVCPKGIATVIKQLNLFDPRAPSKSIPPSDPSVPSAAKPRLSRQAREVLARLRLGPATNGELGAIASRFGARIGDLRKARCVITIFERDNKTGLNTYRLDYDSGV